MLEAVKTIGEVTIQQKKEREYLPTFDFEKVYLICFNTSTGTVSVKESKRAFVLKPIKKKKWLAFTWKKSRGKKPSQTESTTVDKSMQEKEQRVELNVNAIETSITSNLRYIEKLLLDPLVKRELTEEEEKNLMTLGNDLQLIASIFFSPETAQRTKQQIKKQLLAKVTSEKRIALAIEKDGINLSEQPAYLHLLKWLFFLPETSLDSKLYDLGHCDLCGKKTLVVVPKHLSGSLTIVFSIDKLSYLPGLEVNRALAVHRICRDCYWKLLLGCVRIIKDWEYDFKAGGARLYVIPELVLPKTSLGEELQKSLMPLFLAKFRPTERKTIREKIIELRETLSENIISRGLKEKGIDHQVFCVFVLGYPDRNAFRYVGSVKLPIKYCAEFFESLDNFKRNIGLTNLKETWEFEDLFSKYKGAFPLFEGEYRHWGELVLALLCGLPYSSAEIIRRGLLYARTHFYGSYRKGLYINESKTPILSLSKGIIRANWILQRAQNIYKGVEPLEKGGANVELFDKERRARKYLTAFEKIAPQAPHMFGPFLLGVALKKMATVLSDKFVLSKINFLGISCSHLKQLSTLAFSWTHYYQKRLEEKLNLDFIKSLLSEATLQIEKNFSSLGNPQENVFYVLTGYSYENLSYQGDENGRSKKWRNPPAI